MKAIFCAILMLLVASQCMGQLIEIQGGLGMPVGDFAKPPIDEPVQRGAKLGYWAEGAYIYQFGPVHLRAAILFISCTEKEKSETLSGSIVKFRHEFYVFTGGVEKQFWPQNQLRPLISISAGLFNYKTRLVEENASLNGSSDFATDEYHFKWFTRLGLRVGSGLVYEIIPDLIQLRIGTQYNLVFTGQIEGFLGYEAGARMQNYPYSYPSTKMHFWTVSLAFVFRPQ